VENRKNKKTKKLDMLRSICKHSGQSMKSVLKKKRKATDSRKDLQKRKVLSLE